MEIQASVPAGSAPRTYIKVSAARRRVFPGYLIFSRVEADAISVVRILHGAQDYEAVLFADE